MSDTEMEEKSATTLELFFDLVFVFAITQVVGFIVHDPTWSGLLRAATLLGIGLRTLQRKLKEYGEV